MKRQSIVIASAIALVGASLAGCSAASPTSDEVDLRVLVYNNPSSVTFFEEVLVPAFTDKYPDINVQFDSADTNGYQGTVKTRLAAGAVDAVLIDPGAGVPPAYADGATLSDIAVLEQAGAFVDQSDQDYVSRWLPGVSAGATGADGAIYALPVGSNIVNGIFYNKDLFTELGLGVPTTWDEFVSNAEALQAAGTTPLAIGGKDIWPAGLVMLGMVQSLYPDMDALDEGLWDQSIKLSDPSSVDLLSRIQQVFEFTQPTFPGLAYSNVYAEFATENVAMIPDGSWAAPSIAGASPDFDFGYFPLPGSDDAGSNVFGLKPEGGFAISSKSTEAQQDAAKKWIDFFSDADNYAQFIEATSYVPVLSGVDTDANEFLASLSDQLADAITEWEYHYHFNANGSPSTAYPWDYSKIAPLGSETDMTKLGSELQELLVQGQTS